MGATIQPDYQRSRVQWARTSCRCGSEKLLSYEEYVYDHNSLDCSCGWMYELPEFYPTEFKWEEASWTYSHIFRVLKELGIQLSDDQYDGVLDPSFVLRHLHKVTSMNDRETMARISTLAAKLGVSIFWG